MNQFESIQWAISHGAERLADLDTISFLFDGDTVRQLIRADAEPTRGSKEWFAWVNKTGAAWEFRTLAPAEAEPILRRSMDRQIEKAKITFRLRMEAIAFRAAYPVIPMDQGGLAALIAADRP